MLHTFEGWLCSAKLFNFPIFAISLFVPFNFGSVIFLSVFQLFTKLKNTSA